MGWASKDRLRKDLEQAEANTKAYIDSHLHICYSIGKPLVMEKFGYPRDNFSFVPGSPTTARDAYYRYFFTLVADNSVFVVDKSTMKVVKEAIKNINKITK